VYQQQYYKLGYMAVHYLDDYGGAETKEKANGAYALLGKLLENCGLEQSPEKSVAPTTKVEFLGVTVDTRKFTL
jgi:hypothetical protein